MRHRDAALCASLSLLFLLLSFFVATSHPVQANYFTAGGSVGGSNTQVQYNNNGAAGGITNLTTDGTSPTCAGTMTFSGTSPIKFTGTSPNDLLDANGNKQAEFAYVASAVNFPQFTNSATGNPAIITATGTDTNIGLTLRGTGTGTVLIPSQTAAAKVLTIKAAASQSGNLQEWQDSTGAILSSVDNNGQFTVNKITPTTIIASGGGTQMKAASGTSGALQLAFVGGKSGYIQFDGGVQGFIDNAQNFLCLFGPNTASCVNYTRIDSATTTNPIKYQALGTDTNISINIIPKGNGDVVTTKAGLTSAPVVATMFTSTADGSVANTGTETNVLGTGVGTLTLPANSLIAGRTIRVHASGYYSTIAVPGTITMILYAGSTAIASTGAQTPSASQTNQAWKTDVTFTDRTTGSSGTVYGQGMTILDAGLTPSNLGMVNTTTTTLDTTATKALTLKVTWQTADAANTITCTNCTVEVLN